MTYDDEARRIVMRTLRASLYVGNICFSMRGENITPVCFLEVERAIAAQRIGVGYDRTLRRVAEYDIGSDTIYVGFHEAPTLEQRALIIHEGLHAWYDLRNLYWAYKDTSEAAAYLAQNICLRSRGVTNALVVAGDANTTEVMRIAFELAGVVIGPPPQPQLTHGQVERLREAVRRCPQYQPAEVPAGWNGVPQTR